MVQRTGWGKGIVYFIATELLRERGSGCALLVSPLLTLMRNQIEAARRIGVRAETINSTNVADWRQMKAQLLADQFDILLISPERLANEEFLTDYLLPVAGRIGLFVVDEAHCISDWGHDFRPDYRRIVRILKALPRNLPVLATTATANDRVVRDIVDQLGSRLKTIRGPLVRESLWLENIRFPSQAGRMAWLADRIPSLEGSGIVYTLTVRDADDLSAWLRQRGIDARAYHAGREDGERRQLEDMLLRNEVKALVATVALGMGFLRQTRPGVRHSLPAPSLRGALLSAGRPRGPGNRQRPWRVVERRGRRRNRGLLHPHGFPQRRRGWCGSRRARSRAYAAESDRITNGRES